MDKANLALAEYLLERGTPVHIVCYSIDAELAAHELVTVYRVSRPAGSFFLGRPLLNARGRQTAQRVAGRWPGTKVLINGENCIWPGINWVHYVHHAWRPGTFQAPLWFRIKQSLNRWLVERGERAAARTSRLFITNSNRTSRDLVEQLGVEPERIRTVYLGAESDWGPVTDEERIASRRSLGVAGEKPVAVFVGSLGLDERKGFDTLLEAWKILCARPDWDVDLLVAGGGQAIQKYRSELSLHRLEKRVHILGFSKHVRQVLAASDLLISPVRYEAYGLNVQEAICRGIPAIVSEAAGVSERYGENCAPLLLKDPEDVNALVEKCLEWRSNRDQWSQRFRMFGEEDSAATDGKTWRAGWWPSSNRKAAACDDLHDDQFRGVLPVTALAVCVLALISTYWASRRALGYGIVALITWGYFYGIIRANLPTVFSHFIFDSALLGLYLANRELLFRAKHKGSTTLRVWIGLMMMWPLLLVFLPFQPLLVSLVGLRGCALFLPMGILGSELRGSDIRKLVYGFCILNLASLGFGLGEYFLGLTRFYPVNAVTILIYASSDVAGGFYRIPATFATAHLYGGAMVSSIPFLIGGWSNLGNRFGRTLTLAGMVAALVGVLMSATRLNFVLAMAMLSTLLFAKLTMKRRIIFALIIVAVGALALRNERFQRFKSLSDTDYVEERISGSVNRSFFEIVSEYPMGNGLGGGGTSIPYFLQGQVRNPIGMENEYARILSEQGILGLGLWLGFLAWFLSRYSQRGAGSWTSTRRMVWCLSAFGFGTAWIGLGMLTAIPGTALMLLGMGWVAAPPAAEARVVRRYPRQVLFPAQPQRAGQYGLNR